jgi:hypothetical protein
LIYQVKEMRVSKSLEIFTILVFSVALLFKSTVLCLWPIFLLLTLLMPDFAERNVIFTDGASRILASDSTDVLMRPAPFNDAAATPRGRRVSVDDEASMITR